MPVERRNPLRGLVAGLLLLIAFALSAVAMTTGVPSQASSAGGTGALTAQAGVRADPPRMDDGLEQGRRPGDGGRHR